MITRVRIPSRWREANSPLSAAYDREGVADFQLGLGSCGKVVTSLGCEVCPDYVTVVQVTEDGEEKQFFYPIATVTGRIEITQK